MEKCKKEVRELDRQKEIELKTRQWQRERWCVGTEAGTNEWEEETVEELDRGKKVRESIRLRGGGGAIMRRIEEKNKQLHLGVDLAAQPKPVC